MKWYYIILILAVLLDLAILPWFFGGSLIPNLFFTVLPITLGEIPTSQ